MDGHVGVLTDIDEILDQILAGLPLVELLSKRRVCQAWRNSIDRVVANRYKSNFITYNLIETDSERASNSERSNGEFFSTFRNKYGRRVKRVKYETNNFASEHRQMVDTFLKWRQKWTHSPRILFLIHRLNRTQDKECMQNFRQLSDVIARYLPPDCTLVMLHGIICCPGSEAITCLQNEALFFSSTVNSSISVMAWQSIKTQNDRASLCAELQKFLSEQEDLRAFIFYYRLTSSQHIITRWIRSSVCPLLESTVLQNGDAVVLGCAVEGGIQHSQLCSNMFVKLEGASVLTGREGSPGSRQYQKSGAFVAMAVTGKSVFASSIVLDHDINTVKDLNSKVQLLKNSVPAHIPLEKCHNRAFAMMVSCIGRMHEFEWYTDFDAQVVGHSLGSVERRSFEKAFPNIPLIVTHGFGELGGDFNLCPKKDPLRRPSNLMHFHSTIFALIVL